MTSSDCLPRAKVASFDLDNTLITTLSGNDIPKDKNDWKILFPEVTCKLKELENEDFKLVVFTNQAGIGLGKVKISDFMDKVESIATKLDVPLQVFVATGYDNYRKPHDGMWDLFVSGEHFNQLIDIHKEDSFFCGDAAGRHSRGKEDFSSSDKDFALNIGLRFMTPGELFLGGTEVHAQFDVKLNQILTKFKGQKSE